MRIKISSIETYFQVLTYSLNTYTFVCHKLVQTLQKLKPDKFIPYNF